MSMSVQPLRRTDVYPKLLQLYLDLKNDPCPGIDESQPPFSSKGGVTDNAETDISLLTYKNHEDSDVYIETVTDQSASYHGSTESNNLSLKHNTQEPSFKSGQDRYLWGQDWLMPPSLYCKYMERNLYMPLEVDSATSLSSPEPSYGEVNGVDPHLLEIVEQIEYYLSFDNLIYDVKFQDYMNYYEGWVPLPFVASLPKVRELTLNVKVIEEALQTLSFQIEIKDGAKLIRHRDSWQRWKPYAAMN
ncbi:hypothetical protein QN277_005165 [Acacia crassicarpa]|nr:hypothetical protein QN277_005165 [Acacia crassicarpa]